MAQESVCVAFQNNALLPMLFGEQGKHLLKIQNAFDVVTASRGSIVSIAGEKTAVETAKAVLESLYQKLEEGAEVSSVDVSAAIRFAIEHKEHKGHKDAYTQALFDEEVIIKTLKRQIKPYSSGQKHYIKGLYSHDMVFAVGPAGTGKTYLAVAIAVSLFMRHQVERIILSRPAVEAGEKIGFLPGDMKEKVDPYLRPLYDALYDMIPEDKVGKYIANGTIEVAPLAFMRGRTLSNAFIILDEAQNATPIQMKMFLTRMGEGSRMVVTGDITQIDLPQGIRSGLFDAMDRLKTIEDIYWAQFSHKDIVRHPLTAKILEAYM